MIMSRYSLTESYASKGVEPTGGDKKKIIDKIIDDLDSDISEEEMSREDQDALLQLPELKFVED